MVEQVIHCTVSGSDPNISGSTEVILLSKYMCSGRTCKYVGISIIEVLTLINYLFCHKSVVKVHIPQNILSLVSFFLPAQVQSAHFKPSQDPCHISSTITESASAPSTFTRSSASYRNRRYHHRLASRSKVHQTSYSSLPVACEEPDEQVQWLERHNPDSWRAQWRGHRSGSLFSLPNMGSASSHSTCSSPGPSPSPHHRSHSLNRSSSLIPPFRLNVDALIGAEETDVDTGNRVNSGSSVDLTVVSAYIKSSLPQTSRPLSAPPEDVGSSRFPGLPENTYKAATLGRTPNHFCTNTTPSTFVGSHTRSTSMNTSAAPSLSDISINQSDSCSIISVPLEEADKTEEEEVQEFYIWSLIVNWDDSISI